jgi:triphosphoribosyl-dephospho-CoA synthase CitG
MKVSNTAATIAELAVRAMLYEAAIFPSPGLVSPVSTGAHDDMDFFTFLRSTATLFFPLAMCAQIGFGEENAANILPLIREVGKEAEDKMFAVTRGINTQKGLIFLTAIISSAAGFLLKDPGYVSSTGLSDATAQICRGIIEKDLGNLADKGPLTRGEGLYLQYGLTGIRGEVAQGLPTIIKHGLPAFYQAKSAGLKENDTLLHVLLSIMAVAQDTNIVGRHSLATLQYVQGASRRLVQAGGMLSAKGKEALSQLDREFVRRKISPGGSADLTAATLFLAFLLERFGKITPPGA